MYMSTKIYNGYRIFANDLTDAVSQLYALKPQAKQALEDDVTTSFARECIVSYDTVIIDAAITPVKNSVEDDTSSFGHVNAERRDAKFSKDATMDEKEDQVKMEIALFPVMFTQEGKNYFTFTFYSDKSGWIDEASDKIEFYGYWNNTDPDEDVTEEQWERRRTDWEEALLKNSGVPQEEGLIVTLAKEYKWILSFDREEVITRMQKGIDETVKTMTLEKRMDYYADEALRNYLFNKHIGETHDQENAMETYHKVRRMMREKTLDQEDIEYRDNLVEKLKQVLKPEITPQDLFVKAGELRQQFAATPKKMKP